MTQAFLIADRSLTVLYQYNYSPNVVYIKWVYSIYESNSFLCVKTPKFAFSRAQSMCRLYHTERDSIWNATILPQIITNKETYPIVMYKTIQWFVQWIHFIQYIRWSIIKSGAQLQFSSKSWLYLPSSHSNPCFFPEQSQFFFFKIWEISF